MSEFAFTVCDFENEALVVINMRHRENLGSVLELIRIFSINFIKLNESYISKIGKSTDNEAYNSRRRWTCCGMRTGPHSRARIMGAQLRRMRYKIC